MPCRRADPVRTGSPPAPRPLRDSDLRRRTMSRNTEARRLVAFRTTPELQAAMHLAAKVEGTTVGEQFERAVKEHVKRLAGGGAPTASDAIARELGVPM